jgi:hypothetical protein
LRLVGNALDEEPGAVLLVEVATRAGDFGDGLYPSKQGTESNEGSQVDEHV